MDEKGERMVTGGVEGLNMFKYTARNSQRINKNISKRKQKLFDIRISWFNLTCWYKRKLRENKAPVFMVVAEESGPGIHKKAS